MHSSVVIVAPCPIVTCKEHMMIDTQKSHKKIQKLPGPADPFKYLFHIKASILFINGGYADLHGSLLIFIYPVRKKLSADTHGIGSLRTVALIWSAVIFMQGMDYERVE